jgi:hypothetical protein
VDLLRWWKQICPPSPEELVFPDDDGNFIYGDKILKELHTIQEQVGMVRPSGKLKPNGKLGYPNGEPKYNVHALRHFYASIMIATGTEPKRLQQLLGHASLTPTMDTYGHLFPAGQAERDRANKAFAAVLESDSNSVGTSSATEPASARPSVPSAITAAGSRDPDKGVALLRGRPIGTGSPPAFCQHGVTVLRRAPSPNTVLTRQSTLRTRTPAPARKEFIFIEPGRSGWIVTTGTRTLGRYRNYAEAKAAVQELVSSAQPAH